MPSVGIFLLQIIFFFNKVKCTAVLMANNITSTPADSRPREISPCYWPLPLRLRQNTPFSPDFSLDEIFFTATCEEPAT